MVGFGLRFCRWFLLIVIGSGFFGALAVAAPCVERFEAYSYFTGYVYGESVERVATDYVARFNAARLSPPEPYLTLGPPQLISAPIQPAQQLASTSALYFYRAEMFEGNSLGLFHQFGVIVYYCPPAKYPDPQTCTAAQAGIQTGRPIVPATGEKHYTETDYTDTGAHPLSLVRSYRSRWATGQAQSFYNALGQTWSHNYAAGLLFFGGSPVNSASNTTSAQIEFHDGTTLGLTWSTALGGWKAASNE